MARAHCTGAEPHADYNPKFLGDSVSMEPSGSFSVVISPECGHIFSLCHNLIFFKITIIIICNNIY